jgi:NADPH-dependent ferric siderophore reductase
MAEAQLLVAQAQVALNDPAAMLRKLCEHFAEHGTVTATERAGRLDGPFGSVDLEASAAALSVRVESSDSTRLFVVRSSVAEHLVEFAAGEPITLNWSGDGATTTEIPYFREMSVVAARNITPTMRRVTLTGADIAHFESGGFHVRVLVPPVGGTPRWPSAGSDGRVIWPKGEDELTGRVYTIRNVHKERREIDIDVVLHGASPGSVWANGAKAGDPVGLTGPGGGGAVSSDWYLLAGDETALPVIARMAEGLPAGARATLLIEVADAAEEQPIASAATLDLRWLHRNGAEAGTTDLLETAVRAVPWPETGTSYALVGCEHRTAKALRGYLRKEKGLTRDRHLVAAYWRRNHAAGSAGDED